MFEAATYTQRRSQLMQSVKDGVVLILGNEESPMNYLENQYSFRQDSNFLYYCGIDQPLLALLLDVETGDAILFGNELTLVEVVWMGPQPSLVEQAAKVGITEVQQYDLLAEVLESIRHQGRTIHFTPPYRMENSVKLHQWLHIPLADLADRASVRLIQTIVAQRSIKTDAELAELTRAINITRAMHVAVMQQAKPGMNEAHLAGIATGIAVAGGGNLAYPVILTTRGHILHNHVHSHNIHEGQMVLADLGAETASHYAGDITRTFPVSKTFTTQQREIYQLVLDVQLAAIAAMRPGVLYQDVHMLVARQIIEGLKALGLMYGDTDEALAAGAVGLFFPHGLGHLQGLDVHDMEDLGEVHTGYRPGLERSQLFGYRSLRFGKELETGMVLTVEPGVYFNPPLIDSWQQEGKFTQFIRYDRLGAYRDFTGVRLEDNVAITSDGHQVLGDPIPKTVAEVEALRYQNNS